MKTILYIGILLFGWQNLSAQVIPINHNVRNLKVGNVFIYRHQVNNIGTSTQTVQFYTERIVKYDTVGNKVYAVFLNGSRERSDSTGVYWIPISIDKTKSFTQEHLRYPITLASLEKIILLNCDGFMKSTCYPLGDPLYEPRLATIVPDSELNVVLGLTVKNFFLNAVGLGRVDYAMIVGPWRNVYSTLNTRYTTTLCGAVIEGKYYGDSTCLVASSTPLRGEEFSSFSASLAPNPAADITTLRFILPTSQGLTVEIRDMLGREVVSPLVFDALSSGMNTIPIDVSSLPRGVYALRLRSTLGLRATTMMIRE